MQQQPNTTLALLLDGMLLPGPLELKVERIEEALDRLEALLKPKQ